MALQLLKSFVVGTIAFFMMLGLWVLYSMDALMEQILSLIHILMLMNRNLLYTAVTRARKCVTLVGNEVTFQQMIRNTSCLLYTSRNGEFTW